MRLELTGSSAQGQQLPKEMTIQQSTENECIRVAPDLRQPVKVELSDFAALSDDVQLAPGRGSK